MNKPVQGSMTYHGYIAQLEKYITYLERHIEIQELEIRNEKSKVADESRQAHHKGYMAGCADVAEAIMNTNMRNVLEEIKDA